MTNVGRLRGIADQEIELIRSWRNAPAVRKNMYTRHFIEANEHQEWWLMTKEREDQQYFIFEQQALPLGVVAFTNINTIDLNASWAFYASPDAPRGTGMRMEFLALEHVFSVLSLHKLFCEVLAFNKPVIKLHQKFGFKIEGLFRQQHKAEQDFVDVVRLGMLATEWADQRASMQVKLSALS